MPISWPENERIISVRIKSMDIIITCEVLSSSIKFQLIWQLIESCLIDLKTTFVLTGTLDYLK